MANSILAQASYNDDYQEYALADSATITPGLGVELVDDAGTAKAQPVSSAGVAKVRIARERRNPPKDLIGTDTNPVDADYDTAGENVETIVPGNGAELRLRLAAGTDLTTASNANISVGDPVEFEADGTVKLASSGSGIGEAQESIDNSGAASGENPLLTVEF